MSTFTALNGASPKMTEVPTVNIEKCTAPEERPSTSTPAQTQPMSEVSTTQREAWAAQGSDRPHFHSANYPDVEGSHKRKRSGSASVEGRRDTVQERTPAPDSATAAAHPDNRDAYGTPQREYRHFGEDQREKDGWYAQSREERHSFEAQLNSATPGHGQTEEQIDTLRRVTGHMEHGDYSNASPDGDDHMNSYSAGPFTPDRLEGLQQHDSKKRKRNFSNRTKTGCLTCRRRKKKCDEQKPECGNCVRGHFVCAGYPPQRGSAWQKPDNKAAAVPLESKDPTYVPPGAYGMPQQQGPYGNQPVKRDSLTHYRGQALRIDPPQGRPLVTDDDRATASTIPSASVSSPDNKLSAMPYTPGNVFPTPISANTQPPPFGERMSKEYQRVPPLLDMSRTESETPHPSNQLPQINIMHPTRTSSPAPPGQQKQHQQHQQQHQQQQLQQQQQQQQQSQPLQQQQQPTTSNVQVAAQLALSHSQFPQRRTQKEEMLSNRNYYPFDKELCLERERCAAACWRFNNLTSPPTNGVSPEERARLFLEILQPRDPVRISPTEASPITNMGRVGKHVAVETPFTCDYGYNITIGHQVVMGRNCTINDVGEVKIGDNCVIGPNVSIFTATLPIDPKKRQGGQGPQQGKPITIEQDCWIGGGAIILPGRTIGKGSTVGAGSIVTKDVPPFTIVAGNPARVLRGIAS